MLKLSRLVVILALLTSCSVLEYGAIQRQFNGAVQADQATALSPFVDGRSQYQEILGRLSEDYIRTLDPRLQPNAWMIRGLCAWRTKNFAAARESSRLGLSAGVAEGSRDHIMLLLIPALVFEQDVADRWLLVSDKTEAEYDKLKESMKQAWAVLLTSESSQGPRTPETMKNYISYQKWRMAQNWQAMILAVTENDGSLERSRKMSSWVAMEGGLGDLPGNVAEVEQEKVTGSLRQLIELQTQSSH